jgi:ectoine hydroxylase-related dioxygenase (phytanoyl-CoA dioxygenase family)
MGNNNYTMSEEEKYFFDLTGYLIVRGALEPGEVDACNRAIDHFADKIAVRSLEKGSLAHGSSALEGQAGRKELTGMLGWPPLYREPFRKLLVHPVVVSRLNELSGKGFRLDHGPLLIGAESGTEGHQLHGAGEPFSPAVWYHQQNGRIDCRGITVAWQLADVNAGDGGFAIVPGSHKACEPTPGGVKSVEDNMGLVVQPAMKAGDVLFFAETATHGTLPWKGKGERRSVLYKYASRAAARAVGRFFTPRQRHGEWTDDLTPEQRAVLYGPGVHSSGTLPILASDGEKTRVAGHR